MSGSQVGKTAFHFLQATCFLGAHVSKTMILLFQKHYFPESPTFKDQSPSSKQTSYRSNDFLYIIVRAERKSIITDPKLKLLLSMGNKLLKLLLYNFC